MPYMSLIFRSPVALRACAGMFGAIAMSTCLAQAHAATVGTSCAETTAASSPWGVAPSATSMNFFFPQWVDPIATTGVSWTRNGLGIDLQRSIDRYNLLATGTKGVSACYTISSILQLGAKAPNSDRFLLPTDPLWTTYVSEQLRTFKLVKYWEVWNEPPAGFLDNGDGTDLQFSLPARAQFVKRYKDLFSSAHRIGHDQAGITPPVGRNNINLKLGLTANSVNLFWMNDVVQLAKSEADTNFVPGYISLHPYESLILLERGFEPQFASIVPTTKKWLKSLGPIGAGPTPYTSLPVWFTEFGRVNNGNPVRQANLLVKGYVLGLVQGAARLNWFEVADAEVPDGLGLLSGPANNLQPRLSHTALTSLITVLGDKPTYIGWALPDNKNYGFLFQGNLKDPRVAGKTVMILWGRPDATTADIVLLDPAGSYDIIDPKTNIMTPVAGSSLALSADPVILVGSSTVGTFATLLPIAKPNKLKLIRWAGDATDYTKPTVLSVTTGAPATSERGLHWATPGITNIVTLPGETIPVRDASNISAQYLTVDPNFLSFDLDPVKFTAIQIIAEIRKNAGAPTSTGFNLKYESKTGLKAALPEGRTPAQGTFVGFNSGVSASGWKTVCWTITDPRFIGNQGHHFDFDSDVTAQADYVIRYVTVKKIKAGAVADACPVSQ